MFSGAVSGRLCKCEHKGGDRSDGSSKDGGACMQHACVCFCGRGRMHADIAVVPAWITHAAPDTTPIARAPLERRARAQPAWSPAGWWAPGLRRAGARGGCGRGGERLRGKVMVGGVGVGLWGWGCYMEVRQ